jgi:hypothetical protein
MMMKKKKKKKQGKRRCLVVQIAFKAIDTASITPKHLSIVDRVRRAESDMTFRKVVHQ